MALALVELHAETHGYTTTRRRDRTELEPCGWTEFVVIPSQLDLSWIIRRASQYTPSSFSPDPPHPLSCGFAIFTPEFNESAFTDGLLVHGVCDLHMFCEGNELAHMDCRNRDTNGRASHTDFIEVNSVACSRTVYFLMSSHPLPCLCLTSTFYFCLVPPPHPVSPHLFISASLLHFWLSGSLFNLCPCVFIPCYLLVADGCRVLYTARSHTVLTRPLR